MLKFKLIARIFPHPYGAQNNTTQLAKYPRVLYVKSLNNMYRYVLPVLDTEVQKISLQMQLEMYT